MMRNHPTFARLGAVILSMNDRIILFPARICQHGAPARKGWSTALRRLVQMCAVAGLAGLAGCDYLGLQTGTQLEARLDAEGRAVGGACRHAGRALEDCYALNPRVPKAPVFAGWREMNNYMIENKIDVVRPEIPPKQTPTAPAAAKHS